MRNFIIYLLFIGIGILIANLSLSLPILLNFLVYSALGFIIGYLIIAFMIFIGLMFTDYDVKITNIKENTSYHVTGIKKLKYCLMLSILWIESVHLKKQ